MKEELPKIGRLFPLWFQIILIEQRRVKELRQTDAQTLTQLMEYPENHGIIGAVDQIPDGRFRNAASLEQRVIRHILLGEQFLQALADCLIQLHFILHS